MPPNTFGVRARRLVPGLLRFGTMCLGCFHHRAGIRRWRPRLKWEAEERMRAAEEGSAVKAASKDTLTSSVVMTVSV